MVIDLVIWSTVVLSIIAVYLNISNIRRRKEISITPNCKAVTA